MIRRLSANIAKWLLHTGAISQENCALYEYSIFCVLFTFFPLFLTMLIGFFGGMTLEAFIFILPFIIIRKFCGGFHFKSSIACTCVSCIVLAVFLWGIRIVMHSENYVLFSAMVVISVFFIITLSPIDSENRQLSKKEKEVFHKIAIVLSVLFFLLYTLLILTHSPNFAIPVGASLILTASLQLPCLVIHK